MPEKKTKAVEDMTESERETTLRGKRISFDEPPRTHGCRLRRHNGRKGEGLVKEEAFYHDDCYVKTDDFGDQYIKYQHITAILD